MACTLKQEYHVIKLKSRMLRDGVIAKGAGPLNQLDLVEFYDLYPQALDLQWEVNERNDPVFKAERTASDERIRKEAMGCRS